MEAPPESGPPPVASESTDERPGRSLLRASLVAIAASLAVVLVSFPLALGGIALTGAAPTPSGALDARLFTIVAVATEASLLTVGAFLVGRTRARLRFDLRRAALRSIVLASIGVALVNGIGSWAISFTGESYLGFPEIGFDGWGAVAFVVAGLAAPLAEELFFREALLTRVFPSSRRAIAVVSTSALFGLLHAESGGVVLVVTLFLMGVILADLRLRTGSLGPPIVVHGLNNTIALLLALFGSH